MSEDALSVKADTQVEFFLPIFEAYIEKLVQAFSQSRKKDYSDAVWQLILKDGHVGKLLNHHVLLDAWEPMALFLRRESKLYGFIEEKQAGLTEMTYKFRTFFSPDDANSFFKNQIDRPKDFNANAIITLPYIKLLEPISTKVDRVIADKEAGIIEQMKRVLTILSIAEWYLDEADFTVFDVHLKKSVAGIALSESMQLLKEIRNPSASQIVLEKRLKGVFTIGWRYFRAKNELETRYFKKLTSEDPYEVEKGLKLMIKKVSDFRKTQSPQSSARS